MLSYIDKTETIQAENNLN